MSHRRFRVLTALAVGAIGWLKRRSRLPVFVDPSHAAGVAELVLPLALAGIAAGADGLIVEVHNDPLEAVSDGEQALSTDAFADLMARLRPLAAALGRTVDPAPASLPAPALPSESMNR
jgi:3-deoxy-7-phosphoheptulonate synthase